MHSLTSKIALLTLLLLPGCNEDSQAMRDGGMNTQGDSSANVVDNGNSTTAAPGTLVVTVNGEGPLTLNQSSLVVNDIPGLPPEAVYTSFAAQALPNTVVVSVPGHTTGTFSCSGGNFPRVQFSRVGTGGTGASGDTAQSDGTCTIVVTEFGGQGGVIRGTFEAHTENTTGTFDLTNGSFTINRL